MSAQTVTGLAGDRLRLGQSVANPRRLRLGRDGRPLPLSATGDEESGPD